MFRVIVTNNKNIVTSSKDFSDCEDALTEAMYLEMYTQEQSTIEVWDLENCVLVNEV